VNRRERLKTLILRMRNARERQASKDEADERGEDCLRGAGHA
jgi:hypothetical protein